MSETFRARSCSVPYRQGFIGVSPEIHEDHVSLEIWEISAEHPISGISGVTDLGSDELVVANVEIELTHAEARALAEALLRSAGAREGCR